jgi:hypothetical protein
MAKPYLSLRMSGNDVLDLVVQSTGWDEVGAFAWLQDACGEGKVEVRECELFRSRIGDRGEEAERREFSSARVPPEGRRIFLARWEFRRDSVTTALLAPEAVSEESPASASSEVLAPAVAVSAPTRRKHNGLDYRAADAPLVADMYKLIQAEKARSVEDAARAVVGRADGHGEPGSRVKRLAKHYRQTQSAHP